MTEEEIHAELDAAAEGNAVVEETPTEEEPQEVEVEEQPQELPDEPEDNAVRSNLGRKVKTLEEKQEQFFAQMSELLQNSLQRPEQREEEVFDNSYIPTTVEELDQWYEMKRKKETEREHKYQDSYRSQLDDFAKNTDPDIHQAVVKEMMENFNIRRSNDGINDAQINYLNAKASVLEKQVSSTKNPLTKNKGKETQPLGGAMGTPSTSEKTTPQIKLDKWAAEFVAKTGMKEESVQKALSGDAPTYLSGSK